MQLPLNLTPPQNALNRPLRPLAFGVGYIIPLLAIWGAQTGGLAQFAVPLFVFGLIPVLDFGF